PAISGRTMMVSSERRLPTAVNDCGSFTTETFAASTTIPCAAVAAAGAGVAPFAVRLAALREPAQKEAALTTAMAAMTAPTARTFRMLKRRALGGETPIIRP